MFKTNKKLKIFVYFWLNENETVELSDKKNDSLVRPLPYIKNQIFKNKYVLEKEEKTDYNRR